MSSYAPFGYDRVMVQDGAKKRPTLVPDQDAARIVKRIFDMAETGKATLDIARILNEEGGTSPRGKPWSKTSVHSILTNEVYTNTLIWGVDARSRTDSVRVEKAFPVIVSKAQFLRVRNQISSGARWIKHRRTVGSAGPNRWRSQCRPCQLIREQWPRRKEMGN